MFVLNIWLALSTLLGNISSVMAALIIGAALLMRVETPMKIFGYPGLAMILFLIAAAGVIILLLRMLFSDEPE